MPVLDYPGTPGTTLYAGLPSPGGAVVATLTLRNTSGSTQAAHFVTRPFGMGFKAGVMPAGEYPQFQLADDTPCPRTLWGYTTWPDGSMQFCGAMIRVPASIAGSGTLAISVLDSGSAPSASGRSTSDLTAANMIIEVTGVTNLTGVWTASLNDGITVNDDVVLIADGDAGAIWRIGSEFRNGGSAHGQLYGMHYVAALNTNAGALKGLRYMGKAAQPWVEVTSPAAAARVMVGVLKSGSTTLRTLQGTQSGETGTTNITMAHYSAWFTAGADGQWDYVQGGGADAADMTVRVTYDKEEFINTRLVPPYQIALNPTAPTAVSYRPYCIGAMTVRSLGATGERPDIGILPTWAVRHILNQHANDEQSVRVTSLAAGGWRTCLHRRSSRRIVPTVDKVGSYTGLGTTQPTYRFFGGSAQGGINAPASNTSLWSEEEQTHHRASTSYYAYLISGDPVHLDILQDYAAGAITSRWEGGPTWKTTMPVVGACATGSGERDATIQGGSTYKGGGTFFEIYGLRISAWMGRDVGQAAAITPDAAPEKAYFKDVINASFDAANAYNTAMPSSWRDAGFWTHEGPTEVSPAAWMNGYFSNTICHLSSILATSNAATFRAHLSKFYSAQYALGRTVACFASYHWSNRRGNTRIQSAEEALFMLESRFTWSTSTERFTISASASDWGNANGSWSPTAGDIFMFDPETAPGTRPFTGATNWTPMYAVNPTGQTAQVSLSLGGSAADVTSAANYTYCMAAIQNFSPHYSFSGFGGPDDYTANTYGAMRHHEACGDSGIASARAAQDALWAVTGSSFASDPKNAMAAAYTG